ncbi:MAG: response regulator [Endomicrobiales bacterium]|nr:response regulator [Endomicrobiales bacterium]
MANILIVDDENDIVELLKVVLQKDANNIYASYNGKEALEKIGLLPSNNTPLKIDLMILDVMMPDIDGYTIQTKMLENESTHNIPILILTAKGQMKELFSMASNVAAYIEKPFDPDVLKKKVQEILSKNQ